MIFRWPARGKLATLNHIWLTHNVMRCPRRHVAVEYAVMLWKGARPRRPGRRICEVGRKHPIPSVISANIRKTRLTASWQCIICYEELRGLQYNPYGTAGCGRHAEHTTFHIGNIGVRAPRDNGYICFKTAWKQNPPSWDGGTPGRSRQRLMWLCSR